VLFGRPVFLFLFLPLVLLLAQLPGLRTRNAVLLIASLAFYGWGEEVMGVLMLVSIGLNYGFGRWIEGARAQGRGRGVVALAVAVNVGLLVYFKYADWIWGSAGWALVELGLLSQAPPRLGDFVTSPELRSILLTPDGWIRLPIGISFFTFHALSYVIDVWRRDAKVQRHLGHFALYISLFPQLIAGPIVRYRDIADQFATRAVRLEGFTYGIRRFALGLGKKLVIADVCAQTSDHIFALPASELAAASAWLAVICFMVQLYFDFSGYSDMAIGLGHMFGFRFRENFDYPYISQSITEFWRRWHISLSTWFRDYLFIPLGGSRRSPARTYLNLFIVFFLCGMWHGASWNYVVWALYQGSFLMLERAGLLSFLERLPRPLRHVYALGVLLVSWSFLRGGELGQCLHFMGVMFGQGSGSDWWPVTHFLDRQLVLTLIAAVIGSTPWLPALTRRVTRADFPPLARRAAHVVGAVVVLAVLVLGVCYSAAGTYTPFVYFRF